MKASHACCRENSRSYTDGSTQRSGACSANGRENRGFSIRTRIYSDCLARAEAFRAGDLDVVYSASEQPTKKRQPALKSRYKSPAGIGAVREPACARIDGNGGHNCRPWVDTAPGAGA